MTRGKPCFTNLSVVFEEVHMRINWAIAVDIATWTFSRSLAISLMALKFTMYGFGGELAN